MHTVTHEGHKLHYNSDFSGDAILQTPDSEEIRFPGYLLLLATENYYVGEIKQWIDSRSDRAEKKRVMDGKKHYHIRGCTCDLCVEREKEIIAKGE